MRDRLLWLGCLAYAALFTFLGAVKYAAHRNLVDFGIFQQVAASAFGCFCDPLEGSHWAFHFSPILYVAGLAVGIVHSPLVLAALQAIACALCAPPAYAMVRARGSELSARLAGLTVLLYPPLAGLAFGDFHENAFAPAAILWTLYAFDAGKLGLAAVAAIAALAVKEDQAVFLAIAGAAGAIAYRGDARRRNFAAGVALVAVAVAGTFFFAIQPRASANPAWQPERFYAWTGDDLRALAPRGLLERIGFLALTFAPLAFLPFRSRALWLAVPPLLEVLLSRMSTTYTLGTHYAGAWLGYVLFAFAGATAGLDARGRARAALYAALALCVVELLVANPLHPGLNLRARQPRDERLDTVLALLPRGVSVATQEEAYTHLALDDPYARLLPEHPGDPVRACFILIDRDFPDSPRLVEYGPALDALVRRGDYVLEWRTYGVELYRRVTQCR